MAKGKGKKAPVTMMRDKFFSGSRPAVHMGLPKLKMKKGTKLITLPFTIALSEAYARACDPKIQRAYEDCCEFSREIDQVRLLARVPNTNVQFFELIDLATPLFTLLNVDVERFVVERVRTEVFLQFVIEVPLLMHERLGHFALERSATTLYAEFMPSQFALDAGVAAAVSALVDPIAKSTGITSMTISGGGQSVTIDKADAKRIQGNA